MIEKNAKLISALASVIYGTIGVVRKWIPLGSGLVAFSRGVLGSITLILVLLITKKKFNFKGVITNLKYLIPSGILLGLNWAFLFESYRYTSVAVTTVCYYMAPVFLMIVSPFAFKEKLTAKKVCCIIVAFIGMVFISELFTNGIGGGEAFGILLAIISAVFYMAIVVLNKKLDGITAIERTIVQLVISAFTLLPYIIINGELATLVLTPKTIVLLLVIGLIHTALAYVMYFGTMPFLKGQTIAVLSYIDPVLAVILSVVVLREPMSASILIGAILIIGATLVGEFDFGFLKKKQKETEV